MKRASGILLHISSLPSKYGIGTFGKAAYDFVDFLEKSGQKYWQVLPMTPTDYGNSPYQSCSVFAGNPFFIDLDFLKKEGLLSQRDLDLDWGKNQERVDYQILIKNRMRILRKAFKNYSCDEKMEKFCRENQDWLEDYALYMALKNYYKSPWQTWDKALRTRKSFALNQAKKVFAEEIKFQKFVQFKFYEQWKYLKCYANKKGVEIIGDIPIYTAQDSADTWSEPQEFQLNKEGYPLEVAGVPPDAFSETGQLWGNPLYRWNKMKRNGYSWWQKRMKHNQKLYDKVRIDHFRGLESYYAIPYGDKTAQNGKWQKGPNLHFFQTLEKNLGKIDIIAEDLGMLTEEVHKLRKDCGFPGMKILQFAFDLSHESLYLPHNCEKNSVIYTGTHDNNTILGWFESLNDKEKEFVCAYTSAKGAEDISWALVREAWKSCSELAICQMQDLLNLDKNARMNLPGTVGNNWEWRLKPNQITDDLAEKLSLLTKVCFR